jgi:hypothetical protein
MSIPHRIAEYAVHVNTVGFSEYLATSRGGLRSNARLHLLPKAGATQERTLEAVRCKPLLGKG